MSVNIVSSASDVINFMKNRQSVELRDQDFFVSEKSLRETSPTKLEIGDYVGEFDETGKPINGALDVKKCAFLPNGIFVGIFGSDGLPLQGELRTPGFSVKLKTLEDGSRHLSQRSFEGGKVTEFEYRDGQWKMPKTTALNGDLLSGKGEVIAKFNEEEISPKSAKLPPILAVNQKFLPVKQAFENLREKQKSRFAEYKEALADEGDIETSQKLQKLKSVLQDREILISGTIFAELTGIKNEDDQQRYAIVERGVGIKRGLEKLKEDESHLSQEDLERFGNCREYAAQTQKIAIENALPNTFILFGSPDHVFNVAVEKDKMVVIDGWNGDLIYNFSPKEFYKNQSLHAIFDLKIHKDTWLGDDNPNGIARPLTEEVSKLKDLLEARIDEINAARFDPKIQEIIQARVEEKLGQLDPNDAYYHENALELKHIINHFGLSPKLVDKIRDDYVEKFDPTKLVVGNEAYVIYDLFCRDASNAKEEFENLKTEFLSKTSPTINFESDRVKALIGGFRKVRDMEFGEEKSFTKIDKTSSDLDALDLAVSRKPSPSPKKSDAEKIVSITQVSSQNL